MKKIIYFYLIFLVIFIFGIYYLIRNFSLETLKQLTPQITILILIFMFIPMFFHIYGIRIILKDMGYKTSFSKIFYIIRSSLFIENTAPLKVSIPLRIYLYNKFQKIPIAVGTATSTAELLLTLLVPAIISLFAIKTIFTDYSIILPLVAILTIFLIFLIIMFGFNIKIFENSNSKLIKKLLSMKDAFQKSIKKISIKTGIIFLFITFMIYLFSAIRIAFILSIFDLPPLGLVKILYVFTLSFIIGGISLIPGGLGVRDVSMTLLLIQLSVPTEIAIAIALIERTLTMGVSILLGIYSISMLGLRHKDL